MAQLPKPTVAWVLFGFRGRIGRQSFILGQLFMVSLFFVIVARLVAVQGDESATTFWGFMMILLMAVSVFSSFALVIKRLHDLGFPGMLSLVLFVPTVNLIMMGVLMILPSSPQTNEHGPPPFGPPTPR